ncbi:MAG: hypothetical protein JW974_00260 [Alphaproteobacteria bacterium]|nr:hypothetical protein [Alphaproteobacteria bacterium]MBN2675051.1 hypothetical protein [Alphaproteobacteria bacterium]
MKKLALLFAICVVPLGIHAVYADDIIDSARAAAKRNAANAVVSVRQKTDNSYTPAISSASRTVNNSQKADASTYSKDRSVTTRESTKTNLSNNPRNITVQGRSTVNQKVSGRTSINRSAIETPAVSLRTTANRGTAESIKVNRSATRASVARAATNNDVKNDNASAAPNYKKCREVYYSCMDEFCANKDTQLKRCACSTRIHDFDKIKEKMSKVEDKILDFNERLLTVNMDEEDAAAISTATDGEVAYQQDDKSDSKSILDQISKKLKASTTDNNFNKDLSAISLSLNTDSAFDDIDSTLGAATSAKEGTALYNAAIPVCREMAAEICDADGASIVESSYQMAIEQDCNTVAKAYETMQEQAIDKVREGSALLDMSRLDIHQKRNSDDILACKKKILDMMTSSSVCGTDLGKCLDITGRYIDPSTGEAFLTVNLVNLGNLITRPTGNQNWTEVSGNSQFVTFLNSKKTYLEPAMENCQDIADDVWDAFIEDALSQIKLAQEKKLEDMRQSCTSLTTECLSDTAKSISDFDARALSIFGVTADKTVNEMCDGVKTACTALLQMTGGDSDWVGGMTEIQTDKTFDTIVQTCREVGKACIIQTCKSVSGNFGLCESVDKSVNRKSIINRSACWEDVVQCVADAGGDSISSIMTKFGKTPSASSGDFYTENYGINSVRTNESINCDPSSQSCVYDICATCGTFGQPDCGTCRIAEKIWGNCEFRQDTDLDTIPQNMIKETSSDTDTLLSWFAENTGTTELIDSCRDTSCGAGYVPIIIDGVTTCELASNLSSDKQICTIEDQLFISSSWTNCCPDGFKDIYGNCCESLLSVPGLEPYILNNYYYTNQYSQSSNICAPSSGPTTSVTFVAAFDGDVNYYKSSINILLCVDGTLSATDVDAATGWPSGQGLECDGGYFIVIGYDTGVYMSPLFNLDSAGEPSDTEVQQTMYPYNFYSLDANSGSKCVFDFNSKVWGTLNSDYTFGGESVNCNKINNSGSVYPTNTLNNLLIKY